MPALISNYSAICNDPRYDFDPTTTSKKNENPFRSSTIVILLFPFQYNGVNGKELLALNNLSKLQDNWDDNDALAPNPTVIKNATYLVSLLQNYGQRVYHIAPGPNGEIMVDIRNSKGKKSIEIIYYPSRTVFVKFPDSGQPQQGQFSLDILSDLLTWVNS